MTAKTMDQVKVPPTNAGLMQVPLDLLKQALKQEITGQQRKRVNAELDRRHVLEMEAKAEAATTAVKPEKVPARQAAEIVLIKAGRPMHYREITKEAIAMGIVKVRGKGRKPNEAKTMKTIRSFLCEREGTEFIRVDQGVFDLKARAEAAAENAKAKATKASA